MAGLVLAVAAIGLVTLLAGKPLRQEWRQWRAHRWVRQAEQLRQAHKRVEAMRLALAANALCPGDAPTLRAVARLAAALGDPEAELFWRSLLRTGEATAADRVEFGRFAVASRELELAQPQVQWLRQHAAEDVATLQLEAEYHLAEGDAGVARERCRTALGKAPEDRGVKLVWAKVLSQSAANAEQQLATAILRELANGPDAAGLEALELLVRRAGLTSQEAEAVAQGLGRHPLGRAEHWLLGQELRLQWHPQDRATLLASAQTRFAKAGAVERVALGRWLNRSGAYEQTLAALPWEAARQAQDLCLVRLDALAALGRWAEVQETLTQRAPPLDPLLRDLFEARVATELGNATAAVLAWEKVAAQTTDSPAAWLYVAEYAEKVGNRGVAIRAWRRLTQDGRSSRKAYAALVRLHEKNGNTRALRELMKELSQVYPQEPEPRNDLAYLNLLLNEDLDGAKTLGQELVKRRPELLAYRTTLALAHLRLGQPQNAEALYDGLSLDWARALPGWQAVRVAVLGASGRTNLARVEAKRIPLASLKPEELALVAPYL